MYSVQQSTPPEQVIWEYYDGGLWNALPDGDSFRIEAYYSENDTTFYLGNAQMAFQYNLNHLTQSHPRTKVSHRIKRTVFTEDRPEVTHSKMMDLPVSVCVCVCGGGGGGGGTCYQRLEWFMYLSNVYMYFWLYNVHVHQMYM